MWCEPPQSNGVAVSPAASDALLLAAFGYDVTNLRAAAGAFRRRFLALENEAPLSDNERALLQCLIARKRE